ncbi:hypothetical protein AFCA_004502 [Aspergillus flavus]|nr:hypothetical protein AFCA_004502 [Aspergillus flavus]
MATSERGKLFVSSGVEINHPAVGVSEPRRPVDDFEVEDNRVVQEGPTADADSFPDGGYRSWLVVLGSFLLLMSSYGLMNSVGVLQSYLESHQLANYSSQNVGWISGLFVFVSLGLGVFVGPLFDTYGPRELVSAGSAFYVLSLFLTAECTQYWHFIVCFGIMAGIGGAFTSTIGMSCVPHWFQARAGMAIGTAMAGAGLGGVVFPFILKGAFANLGFQWGMRILALVILVLCGLASFLVKSRLPKGQLKAAIDIRSFKDSRFTLLSFGIFSRFLTPRGCHRILNRSSARIGGVCPHRTISHVRDEAGLQYQRECIYIGGAKRMLLHRTTYRWSDRRSIRSLERTHYLNLLCCSDDVCHPVPVQRSFVSTVCL